MTTQQAILNFLNAYNPSGSQLTRSRVGRTRLPCSV